MTASRPAWREPMLWLVVALPLASVIAGITTLTLALRSGGADAVPGEVRRTAQIQIANLAADQRALHQRLSATLQVDAGTGALELQLDAALAPPRQLQLDLIHPSRAELDRSIPLVQAGAGWHGRLDRPRDHAWNLRLRAPDANWRLVGRLEREATRTSLMPALRE